jgi:hypothetical protein
MGPFRKVPNGPTIPKATPAAAYPTKSAAHPRTELNCSPAAAVILESRLSHATEFQPSHAQSPTHEKKVEVRAQLRLPSSTAFRAALFIRQCGFVKGTRLTAWSPFQGQSNDRVEIAQVVRRSGRSRRFPRIARYDRSPAVGGEQEGWGIPRRRLGRELPWCPTCRRWNGRRVFILALPRVQTTSPDTK